MQIISKYTLCYQEEKAGIDAIRLIILVSSLFGTIEIIKTNLRSLSVSPLAIFVIRAVVGLAFAAIVTRMFYGRINPVYIVGLAVILVGLAYFAEYLRNRKKR
jgi:hypothetical protein